MDAEAAEATLAELEDSDLAKRYPAVAPGWRRAWNEVIAFLDDPPEGRKADLHDQCHRGAELEDPPRRANPRATSQAMTPRRNRSIWR